MDNELRWREGSPLPVAPAPSWEATEPLTVERCYEVFGAPPPFTIGLEEELVLVDPKTLELTPRNADVVALMGGDPYRRELRAAQLEIVTPVCASAAAACDALCRSRASLTDALDGEIRILSAGTHPTSVQWGEVSDAERYRLLADEYEWAARRSLMCGLHVHVAVGGADRTLAVHNTLRSFLPEIAALAANSPFAEGRDTGLCSMRAKLNEAFPRAGVPPAFATWGDFVGFVEWGRTGGLFPDTSHLWWDLRLHPTFGTLEIRVADAQTRVGDNAAVAAVIHSLVVWLARRFDAGELPPVHDHFRVHENLWRALKHGVRGWLVDCDSGVRQPTRERVAALLDDLEPTAAEIGAADELNDARVLLAGNGAERQRYVAEREGMRGLVEWLVKETEERSAGSGGRDWQHAA